MSKKLVLDRYIEVKPINEGSQATIKLMKDTKDNNKFVVMKEIKEDSNIDFKKSITGLNILKELQHPNIIQYYDSVYEPPNKLSIILEYANGQDLSVYLKKNPKMKYDDILTIFSQIILGISYLHSKKIIHRDLKCENIFLFKNKLVKIGDFGISRKVEEDDFVKTIIGSPINFAPEIQLRQPYSFPADIWAAGCILYKMMTGKHPFYGKNIQEILPKILGEHKHPPGFAHKKLGELYQKMVSLEPSDRPTAAEILKMPIIRRKLESLQQNIDLYKENINEHSNLNISAIDNEDIQIETSNVMKNDALEDEFKSQCNQKLERDTSALASMIRSLDVNKSPQFASSISSNLPQRRDKLVSECKQILMDKYSRVYDFILENGMENRKELLEDKDLPEDAIKKVETIIMIERFLK